MRDAPLEPIDPRELAAQRRAAASTPRGSSRNWVRVKAGLLVELGLADRTAARRAQEAIASGAFEVDQAAAELVGGAGVADDDPRLSERAARLARDLVMAPLQRGVRGAARRARRATRRGAAWALAQFLVVGALLSLFAVALLVLRYAYGLSVDLALDRVLQFLPER